MRHQLEGKENVQCVTEACFHQHLSVINPTAQGICNHMRVCLNRDHRPDTPKDVSAFKMVYMLRDTFALMSRIS